MVINSEAAVVAKSKVLIVDDEPEIGDLLKLFLEDDFDVETYTDPRLACSAVEGKRYDLVVSDIRMPHLSGLDVVRHVKKSSPTTEVILITGHAQTEKDVDEARSLGASGVLFKPLGDPGKLISYLSEVIAKRGSQSQGMKEQNSLSSEPKKPAVMVIDDEEDLLEVVVMMLADEYEVDTFENPVAAIEAIEKKQYRCILTDLTMPQMTGTDAIGKLKKLAPNVPIIVMSGHAMEDKEVQAAMNAGATDLLAKPFPDPIHVLGIVKRHIK